MDKERLGKAHATKTDRVQRARWVNSIIQQLRPNDSNIDELVLWIKLEYAAEQKQFPDGTEYSRNVWRTIDKEVRSLLSDRGKPRLAEERFRDVQRAFNDDVFYVGG